MATPIRYFQKGAYYHVYNRGNRKEKIFFTARDYNRFMEKIMVYAAQFPLSVLSFCLMPNHFHFLIRQNEDMPISYFMLRLGTSYSKYFNIKYAQVGSLFQGRFKAKLIDSDEYLLHASRYIHRNPLSTPGVDLATYPWSSYRIYCQSENTSIIETKTILGYFTKVNPTQDYMKFVEYELLENNTKIDFNCEDL